MPQYVEPLPFEIIECSPYTVLLAIAPVAAATIRQPVSLLTCAGPLYCAFIVGTPICPDPLCPQPQRVPSSLTAKHHDAPATIFLLLNIGIVLGTFVEEVLCIQAVSYH